MESKINNTAMHEFRGNTYLLLECPKRVKVGQVNELMNWIDYTHEDGSIDFLDIPEGSWIITGISNFMSDEDIKSLVEWDNIGFKFYYNLGLTNGDERNIKVGTARQSVSSLCRSKGLDPDNKFIIVLEKSTHE